MTFTPTNTATNTSTYTPTATLTPTPTPIPYNGTGEDGDLVVGSGQTYYTDNIRSALSGANGNSLTVANPTGFAAGQQVLIIQIQGMGAGTYEFGQIASVSGNTIFLQQNLANSYYVGGSSNAQVINVPQYQDVTVQSGGEVTAHSWDGSTGGIIAFQASGIITVNGTISINGSNGSSVTNTTGGGATGGGFRGGNATMNSYGNRSIPAFAGEGMSSPSISTSAANGVNGGGAGHGICW